MGTYREDGERKAASAAVTLGLVAHDAKKEELGLFARAHRRILEGVRLVAPLDTARALEEAGVDVESLAPDILGGDIQLQAAVVEGRIDGVIFLHDPLSALAGEPDLRTMLKVCDVERVPLATNLASAEIVLHALVGARAASDRWALPHPAGRRVERVLRLAEFPETDGTNGRG